MGTESVLETEPLKTETKTEEGKLEDIPQLDPNMKIKTDQGEVVLGEAIKSHFAAQSAPPAQQFTPEQLQMFETMQKALDGDVAAGRQLWDQSLPEKEEAVVDPASPQGQLLSLQEQVKELKVAAEHTGQVSKDIVDAANAQQAAQLIAGAKKDYPWLAHHPAGSHKLVARIQYLNAFAQQNNVDPAKADIAQRIRTAAFQSLNTEIETEMKPFGVTAESLSALAEQVKQTDEQQNLSAKGIIDDQQRGGQSGD